MPFCKKCGNPIEYDSKFCSVCGKPTRIVCSQGANGEARRVTYCGTVYKCPNCGEIVPSFTSICSACGFEIRDAETTKATRALCDELLKASNDDNRLLLVKTFPIPNSKEDILEFMILAASNIDADYYVTHKNENGVTSAWLSKLEQCYQKARTTFKNGADFQEVNIIYKETHKKIQSAARKRNQTIFASIVGIVFGCLLIMTKVALIQTIGLAILAISIVFLCIKKSKKQRKNNG